MSKPPDSVALRSRYRGCFLGGAVGDALGAPVEFMSLEHIRSKYGPSGIRDMDVAYGVMGAITDDTQMTLFTAEGLIRAHIRLASRGICNPLMVIRSAYLRWMKTQGEEVAINDEVPLVDGWLISHQGLHHRRAPGNTCLAALHNSETPPDSYKYEATNNSKGCGGVMRVAPVGLVAYDPYEFGCDVAHLTHGHPLGYQSAGALAVMISHLKAGETIASAARQGASASPSNLRDIIKRAIDLAHSSAASDSAIAKLGEGWVAEEALAISVYCAIKADTLEEGIILAVNHKGDSDSTGSITGQLMGTALGSRSLHKSRFVAIRQCHHRRSKRDFRVGCEHSD